MPRNKEQSEQMRAASQAQILASARRLFSERGFFSCKVADIAREAGMSAGNVYWYYASKDEILKAVLAEGFERQETLLSDAAGRPGQAREKLDHLIGQYLAFCREQSEFLTVLMAIFAHGGAPYLETLGFDMREIGAAYHRHLTAILMQGQAEGSIIQLPPDVLAMLFFSLFNGLVLTYGSNWRRLPADAFHDAVLRLLGS
jgi:AcrR family transcriptional regulator